MSEEKLLTVQNLALDYLEGILKSPSSAHEHKLKAASILVRSVTDGGIFEFAADRGKLQILCLTTKGAWMPMFEVEVGGIHNMWRRPLLFKLATENYAHCPGEENCQLYQQSADPKFCPVCPKR